jgi:hypothetical protein
MFHRTLIWGRSRPIARSRSAAIFCTPPPRQGKNVACEGVMLIGLCFRARLSRIIHIRGKRMAIIPMIPVGPVTTLSRSILLTERGMSGTGGTILFAVIVAMSCWRISILQQSGAILSISAASVKTTMTFHSPRAMVTTGPHGEISQRPLPGNSHPPQLGPLT